MRRIMIALSICSFVLGAQLQAADLYGLSKGTPEIKSAGPLAFGPEGILFIGDPMGASVFAVQTGDQKGDAAKASHQLDAYT